MAGRTARGEAMNHDNRKLEKALHLMNQRGLNGLIIYSDGTNNILYPSYFHYFSGLKPLGPRNAVILSKSGEIILLIDPPWDTLRASKKSWIAAARGSSDFVKDLSDIIRKFKISRPVGLAGSRTMTGEIYAEIKKVVDLQSADDIIEEMAREKTELEIETVRNTARIADIGFKAFLKKARVGIREYELSAELESAVYAAGADDFFFLMSSGRQNVEMHEPTDRRLREGDILIGEITPVCEGQFVQICRTIVLGKAGPLLEEKYRMLVRSMEISLTAMKAGAPASIIAIAMNQVIAEAGYAKYCMPPYMRARGHGFGVGSIAPGAEITENMDVNLEKHQIVAIHPNQYLPEAGYLACGETVLVTDTGIERLAGTETRLYEKAE